MMRHIMERRCLKYNYITCENTSAQCRHLQMCMSLHTHTHVLTHVTYVLPVIDRNSNDQHQCVIDVLSFFSLLMLSQDEATGLLETWCVCVCVYMCVMHACELLRDIFVPHIYT